MFNNYPPGANMDAYFAAQDANDRFEERQDNVLNEVLPDVKHANLAIVYDPTDGEQLDDRTYPYATYYNTKDNQFQEKLNNDLLDYDISQDQINQLFKDAQTYEISDLLEEVLPDSKVFIGQNTADLDNAYINYYAV